jgi:antirestriction protein ArdC
MCIRLDPASRFDLGVRRVVPLPPLAGCRVGRLVVPVKPTCCAAGRPPFGRLTATPVRRPEHACTANPALTPDTKELILMQANDLFTAITTELIADIEAGTGTWKMPWHCLADIGTPVSADGRPYRGMNALWLALSAVAAGTGETRESSDGRGWRSGIWSTYRSWQRHGCQVRRGEKGTAVVLWKPTTSTADDTTDTGSDEQPGQRRLIARTFTVFAAEQVDGADKIIGRHAADRAGRDTPERLAEADRYFAAIGGSVIEGGNRAYYSPTDDSIHLPMFHQFESAAVAASTKSHEFAHWTGSAERLARDLTGRFGSDAYAAEELVAELAAAMWCGQMGISAATRTDHAQYLAGWISVLKTDARALVTVASKAQAAVDYLNVCAGYSPEPAEEATLAA